MFKYLVFLTLVNSIYSLPNKLESSDSLPNKLSQEYYKPEIPDNENMCCIDHHKKKNNDLLSANYDCSQLNPYGYDMCKGVLGGNVCKWEKCLPLSKCGRKPKYELHFGKKVDVGKCAGICKSSLDSDLQISKNICSPSIFDYKEVKKGKVKVIKECECQNCGVKNHYGTIKVPIGRCYGKCEQRDNMCLAGVEDNYSITNGMEVSNPSLLLLNSAAGICPLGVQSGFDIFMDNRCFVHTFEKCIRKSECPIRTLLLDICMEAAQVSLTNTDSLRLGTNGNGLWGIGLPVLNGGNWNPGDNLCTTFDLNNLNGGISIVNNVVVDDNLDVLVQDDSAVDFLRLTTIYENCEQCLPTHQTVHSFYLSNGFQEFRHIKDCDCLDMRKCHREKLEETYHTGTNFEVTLDVGQCIGKCDTGSLCNKEVVVKQIKSPYGLQNINIIEGCYC